jgi:putative transposon-encoded protein
MDILWGLMKTITLQKGQLSLRDEVEGFLERRVTKFGNSAKVDCPKAFLGRRVYLVVCKDE